MERPNVEPKIAESLERIVEYLFWDEIRHWEARGRPRNHIYRDVRRIDKWLGEITKGKPDAR